MQRYCRTKKVISMLLVLALLSCLLTGCSSKAISKIDEKLELAVKYLSEQKYDEAILAYQEVIKIDNKNVTAYKGMSLAYTLQDKPEQAEQALQDGLKAIPNNPQLNLAMAGLMIDQDKGDQAEAIYKDLVSGASTTAAYYRAYIYFLNSQGKIAEAIALLEQALGKKSDDYQLNAMLAELYIKNGDKEKALAAVNKSMITQLDQSTTYNLLAGMYKDKWTELIALGDQYIQQNQANTGQLLKLSGLLGMGKYDDVIKLYGELAADLKDNTRARYMAAQAYLKLNQNDQSTEILKAIKTADIKDAGMLADLASHYLDAGDKENARKIAMLGIGIDETVVENYAVMYRSYAGEDDAAAKIWAYKYLLKSGLGYSSALRTLANAGITLNIASSTGVSAKGKGHVIFTQDQIEKIKSQYGGPGSAGYYSKDGYYFDREKDIAYDVNMFPCVGDKYYEADWKITSVDQTWKNVVGRIHHPKVIPVGEISIPKEPGIEAELKEDALKRGISQAIAVPSDGGFDYGFITHEGNFEKDVTEAGESLDSIIFVDIQ